MCDKRSEPGEDRSSVLLFGLRFVRRRLLIYPVRDCINDKLRDPLRSAEQESLHPHGSFKYVIEMQTAHVLALQLVLLIEQTVLHRVDVMELHRHRQCDGRDAVSGRDGRIAQMRRQLFKRLRDVTSFCSFFAHDGAPSLLANSSITCLFPSSMFFPTISRARSRVMVLWSCMAISLPSILPAIASISSPLTSSACLVRKATRSW